MAIEKELVGRQPNSYFYVFLCVKNYATIIIVFFCLNSLERAFDLNFLHLIDIKISYIFLVVQNFRVTEV